MGKVLEEVYDVNLTSIHIHHAPAGLPNNEVKTRDIIRQRQATNKLFLLLENTFSDAAAEPKDFITLHYSCVTGVHYEI